MVLCLRLLLQQAETSQPSGGRLMAEQASANYSRLPHAGKTLQNFKIAVFCHGSRHLEMSTRSSALIVLFAGICIASSDAQVPKSQKNLIQNGDFSEGVKHWKGDGKVDVFKEEPAATQKSGSASDAAKSPETAEKPPTSPPPSPSTPQPRLPFGAAPAKLGAGVDRSYCVTLGSRPQNFYQSVSLPRGAKSIKVTFRARTAAGFLTSRNAVGAFQVSIVRPDRSSTYNDEKLETTPGWQIITDTFETKDARSVNVQVEVYPGSGQIYFDDFVVEAI
jgi:hypothetical protein